MMTRKVAIAAIALTAIATATVAYGDCDHSRKLAISPADAAGVRLVRIDASAGSLEVIGSSTQTTISAGGRRLRIDRIPARRYRAHLRSTG